MEADEQRYLSCAYDSPTVIDQGVAAGLTSAHFTDRHYGEQWNLLVELRTTGEACDTGSVYALAHGSNRLDRAGGIVKITQGSAAQVGTGASAKAFLGLLLTRHAQRESWKLLQRAREMVEQDGVDLAEVSSLAEEVVGVCSLKKTTHRNIDDIDAELAKRQEQARTGVRDEGKLIKWGLPKCDRFMTPIKNHELVLVCARPSIGKSSMLTHLTGVNLQRNLRLAYFSLETSDTAVYGQIAGQIAGLDVSDDGMRGWMTEHHNRFNEVRAKMKASKRLLIFDRDMTLDAISSRCRLLAASWKPDAVFIDYMGLIQGPGKSQYERTTVVSNALVGLRKQLGCPLIVANQLNRDGDGSDGKQAHEPKSTNLRDSGHLEQDAHRIVIIHWQDSHKLDVPTRDYKLLQPKLRDGPATAVPGIKFHAPTTKFSEA